MITTRSFLLVVLVVNVVEGWYCVQDKFCCGSTSSVKTSLESCKEECESTGCSAIAFNPFGGVDDIYCYLNYGNCNAISSKTNAQSWGDGGVTLHCRPGGGQEHICEHNSCTERIRCGDTIVGGTVGNPNVLGNLGGDSLYSFRLDRTTKTVFNTCGSSYNLHVRIFDGAMTNEITQCDDYCGLTNCGLQPVMKTELSAGDYVFVVDSHDDTEGKFEFDFYCCTEDTYECYDHRCIPNEWRCDGWYDCWAGEDEAGNCPDDSTSSDSDSDSDYSGDVVCNSLRVGDGYCDFIYNDPHCDWDGGDCCVSTCVDHKYKCGIAGFQCFDPAASCRDRDHLCLNDCGWSSMFGGCESYEEGKYNHQFCDDDAGVLDNKLVAADACPASCGRCPDNVSFQCSGTVPDDSSPDQPSPTDPPIELHTDSPESVVSTISSDTTVSYDSPTTPQIPSEIVDTPASASASACKDDVAWDSVYGDCTSYRPTGLNKGHCDDFGADGKTAFQACPISCDNPAACAPQTSEDTPDQAPDTPETPSEDTHAYVMPPSTPVQPSTPELPSTPKQPSTPEQPSTPKQSTKQEPVTTPQVPPETSKQSDDQTPTKNCAADEFECNDGVCIRGSMECDGWDDCDDKSDEHCDSETEVSVCKDDDTYDSGFGNCLSYKTYNRNFCFDDVSPGGVLAADACPVGCDNC